MDYLCMAVQREVVRRECFGGMEQAQMFFWENFGEDVTEKLEEEKKKLEGRIRYYTRREGRYEKEPEIRSIYTVRREQTEKALARLCWQMQKEGERAEICYIEDRPEMKGEFKEVLVSGKRHLVLHLAGIYRVGSSFRVLEEKYYCRGWRSTGAKGALEARKMIPEEMDEDSISLDVCRESEETWERFERKLKKMVMGARRNFQASRRKGAEKVYG